MAYNQCLKPLPQSIQEFLIFSHFPDPLPPKSSWIDAIRNWCSFVTSQFTEDYLTSCVPTLRDYRIWSRSSALLIPWGTLCVRLVQTKLDKSLSDVEQLESVQIDINMISMAKEHVFDQLGSQFSVASIVHEIQSQMPVVQLDNVDQLQHQSHDFEGDVAQQLQEVNSRITKITEEARLVFK